MQCSCSESLHPISMTSFAALQRLYDTNRFLEAFHQSADYWNPARRFDDLSCDELILGGRLAARLGGRRLSRWLLRSAFNRYPSEPRVRYFASHLHRRGWKLFEQLRESESSPELPGADSRTQADWLATRPTLGFRSRLCRGPPLHRASLILQAQRQLGFLLPSGRIWFGRSLG